jgi:predicted metal-binding membrane protein
MNVVWMAGLGIVMTLEKLGTGRAFTYAIGAVLIVAGAAFIIASFAAPWPVRAI